MKKIVVIFIILLSTGCDVKNKISVLHYLTDQENVWVFSQFNVREDTEGLDSYYYYGKVYKALLEAIKNNKISKGFILLEEVKYWGDDDLIYEYRDLENTGELIFRIENIVKINIVHTAPIVGKGFEQYEKTPLVESELPAPPNKSSKEAT